MLIFYMGFATADCYCYNYLIKAMATHKKHSISNGLIVTLGKTIQKCFCWLHTKFDIC